LNDPYLSAEVKKSYIDLVESNTESLLVLIDDIIDLSKIEAQQLTLKMQDFSIDALLEELFAIFNHGHRKTGVDLKIARISPEKELFVFSDRVRVKQVFVNLLTNALKFTESGFVEMGYSFSDNSEIVLYVQDSGIGISDEFHTAIFHRFRKLNENSGKIFRGTGLGLAITQKLVELLGGKIWLESEPGKGSTFYFTLDGLTLSDISS
jgi:signal transduction histidine kinase